MIKISKNSLTIITILLLFTYSASVSCNKRQHTVDDSIIQVWEKNDETGQSETLLSYGVVIGDGKQALTVIDFSMYSPVSLEIISDTYGKRKASIQVIDSRTNMTLLKYEGDNMPAAGIGDIDTTAQGQEIFIRGWENEKLNYVKIATNISTYQNLLPLGFLIDYIDYPEMVVDKPGAVITDNEGRVLGLMGCYHYSAIYLGLPGMYFFPPIININNGLELSSPQADQQPWANGPILFFYRNYGSDIPGYSNYDGLIKN